MDIEKVMPKCQEEIKSVFVRGETRSKQGFQTLFNYTELCVISTRKKYLFGTSPSTHLS